MLADATGWSIIVEIEANVVVGPGSRFWSYSYVSSVRISWKM